MTTYYARKEYNYSGGDAIFGIPFDYIKKEHISVSINGEATENYTYLNNSQIRITDTLIIGDVVTIARTTPISSKMVVFSDTSILNKDTQNLAQDQVFDAVQEIYDNNMVFEANVDSNINAISEVANTALTNSNTAINTANSADSKANTAVSTANSADSKADSAVSTANTASTNATTAVNTANTASQNATTALNTANNADSKADIAISTANTAKNTADTAKSTADTALSNSTTALSNSQTAVSTANTAKNTADSAKSTAESAASDAADAVSTANSASDVADAASDKVDDFGEDIASVISAAEKINELEEAVQTAVDAATTASDKADLASDKADDAIAAADRAEAVIPSQTGHNGQFLKTNGTQTNWEKLATVATSGSYNDLTNKPTIDTAISRTSTNAVQNKVIQNYIVSRGENLVANGFATLGNNYNFNAFTFDGSDTYGAGGCFSYTSTPAGSRGSLVTNEYMPVDITQSYKLSYAVKNSTSTSTYDYINMYDIDKNLISRGNVEFVQGTTTTLAQELKDGDTKVYLTNISNDWHTGEPGTSGANYYRGLIFWNYINSFGYQYPIEYYSRNWWYDLWKDDNDVDAVNGVITLRTAWNHGTFPAGTPVSQSTTSGGNVYGNANYIPPMGEWTEKSFIFTSDRFRNGTSYITLGWLYNYSQMPSNVFKISSISLTQNLSIKDALTSESYATGTVGGVVKVGSVYGTNINNGYVTTFKASNADIDAKTHQYRPIVPSNLDYAVKKGITSNALTLTDAEKTAAQNWLGVSNGIEVGDIIFRLLPTQDSGKHLLDGALINGSGSYAAFVSYIADLYADNPTANYFTDETTWQQSITDYGVCGKFVYDDVNNTVRLPKITGIVEGTIDASALGDLVEAGLPNITGELKNQINAWALSGAFYNTETGSSVGNFPTNSSNLSAGFDASRSDSTYGNLATGAKNKVQPQAIKGYMYIVIATTTKTDIEIDIDQIATDLNGKMDVDLTNVNNNGKKAIANVLTPDIANVVVNPGVSGTVATNTEYSYTFPSDGYLHYSLNAYGGNNNYAYVKITDENNVEYLLDKGKGGTSNVYMPILNGDILVKQGWKVYYQLIYNNSVYNLNQVHFIPLKGIQ